MLSGCEQEQADASELAEEPSIAHSFFIAGPTLTGIIDENGSVLWDSGKGAARDGYVLPNGHVLICWTDVVHEYDSDKNIIFTYELSESNEELGTAVRLSNGLTMPLARPSRLLDTWIPLGRALPMPAISWIAGRHTIGWLVLHSVSFSLLPGGRC